MKEGPTRIPKPKRPWEFHWAWLWPAGPSGFAPSPTCTRASDTPWKDCQGTTTPGMILEWVHRVSKSLEWFSTNLEGFSGSGGGLKFMGWVSGLRVEAGSVVFLFARALSRRAARDGDDFCAVRLNENSTGCGRRHRNLQASCARV